MAKKKKIEKTATPVMIPENAVVQETNVRSVGEIAENCYVYFGGYVNNHRAIANVKDGLKVSYKRLVWAAMQFPKGQDVPTMNLIASVSKWHGHGLSGIEGLNAQLVKSGVFSGSGFFGNTQIDGVVNEHAATRYTKNRLSDLYWGITGDLVKEVPMVESMNGPLEPEYIPLVFPLCLYMKGGLVSGLGVGVRTIYPNFSPKSMYLAYINNDPRYLEPNIDILLDKENSEL